MKEKTRAIGAAVKTVAAKAAPGLDVRALAAAAGKASAEVTAKALAARQAREAAAQIAAQARAVLDAQRAVTKAIGLATPGNVIRPGIDRGFSR